MSPVVVQCTRLGVCARFKVVGCAGPMTVGAAENETRRCRLSATTSLVPCSDGEGAFCPIAECAALHLQRGNQAGAPKELHDASTFQNAYCTEPPLHFSRSMACKPWRYTACLPHTTLCAGSMHRRWARDRDAPLLVASLHQGKVGPQASLLEPPMN
jgi:hypothetical protein